MAMPFISRSSAITLAFASSVGIAACIVALSCVVAIGLYFAGREIERDRAQKDAEVRADQNVIEQLSIMYQIADLIQNNLGEDEFETARPELEVLTARLRRLQGGLDMLGPEIKSDAMARRQALIDKAMRRGTPEDENAQKQIAVYHGVADRFDRATTRKDMNRALAQDREISMYRMMLQNELASMERATTELVYFWRVEEYAAATSRLSKSRAAALRRVYANKEPDDTDDD